VSNPEELEHRVRRLEERLDLEAGLRASIDRDLWDTTQRTGAHKTLLQTLRDTQIEQTQTLNFHSAEHQLNGMTLSSHTGTLRAHTGMLDKLNTEVQAIRREHGAKLDEHSAKLDQHSAKLDLIDAKLDRLIEAAK
jgi:hypothetical protein